MSDRSAKVHFDDLATAWTSEFPDAALDHFLLAAALMRLGVAIEKDLFDQAKALFDIGGAELGLLLALRRQGPPYAARPRTLARLLLLTSGAVTKQVDRLEKKGLILRAADPESRNGLLVSLTLAGIALTGQAVHHLAENSIGCQAADRLPPSVVAGGRAFLQAMLETLESRHFRPAKNRSAA